MAAWTVLLAPAAAAQALAGAVAAAPAATVPGPVDGGRRSSWTGYCAAGTLVQTAGPKVLLVHAESIPWIYDVQSKLQETGAFIAVDRFSAESGTPSLSDLQPYTAVLVWTDGFNFASTSGLGDVLAEYWDGGGAVVVAYSANADSYLQGRFGTVANGYILIDGTASSEYHSDQMRVMEPDSPLMAGVASLTALSAERSTGAVINGGIVIAEWASNGRPLVVRGAKAGRPLVALNMAPVSASESGGGWIGDGANLMRNTLLYSSCVPCAAGTFAAAGAQRIAAATGARGWGGAGCCEARKTGTQTSGASSAS